LKKIDTPCGVRAALRLENPEKNVIGRRLFEDEYEYHFIEYEYDKSPNSDLLAVGCGLNDCSCFASDFALLVLDGS
jgi:hypothetical protein